MKPFENETLFSFLYDGLPCGESLLSYDVLPAQQGETRVYTYKNGLRVTEALTFFPDFGAYEWGNTYENTQQTPTGLIEALADCDVSLPMAHEEKDGWTAFRPALSERTAVYVPRGSNLSDGEFDYRRPRENSFDSPSLLLPGRTLSFGSAGGRSSCGDAPFFNIHRQGRGYFAAVGWSGQWRARLTRASDAVRVAFGMEHTRFRLMPGERLRVCSAVILPYEAPLPQSFNLWRRFVKTHFSPVPAQGGEAAQPLSLMLWGGMESGEMLRRLAAAQEGGVPFDTVWIDAGWYGDSALPCPDEFEGDWGSYTGDWRVNLHLHSDGLRDVERAVHAAGKKLLLWVEPERVRSHTPVAKAHPEYFFAPESAADADRLLDLGRADAWQYCFETVSGLIDDLKLDWYRQDFNMDPLPLWRANDLPEREGISEILHISGLYRLWDALRARFPHLLIDNCASGGRRIDIETLRRSVPLWRSDLQCPENCPPGVSQAHSVCFAEWLPYSGTGAPGAADGYGFLSCLAPALGIRAAYAQSRPFGEDPAALAELRRRCESYRRLQPYLTEDVYALTVPGAAADLWAAAQYYRPSDGSGAVVCFRREDSPYESASFVLHGVSPEKTYLFTDDATGETAAYPGAALLSGGLPVHMPRRPGSRILFFRQSGET